MAKEHLTIDGETIELLEKVTGEEIPVKEKNFNNKWRREKRKKRRNRKSRKIARKARRKR